MVGEEHDVFAAKTYSAFDQMSIQGLLSRVAYLRGERTGVPKAAEAIGIIRCYLALPVVTRENVHEQKSLGGVLNTSMLSELTGGRQPWDGEEWQRYFHRLLKLRYGLDFQDVPSRHVGDFGLDGFCQGKGIAFQCYAAEEPLSTRALYENQRDKMTADLRKFKNNSLQLGRVLGKTVIRLWVFAVPYYSSAYLVAHAQSKALEVREADLPYVHPRFRIAIVTDEHFALQRQQLVLASLASIATPWSVMDDEDIQDWSHEVENSPLLVNLSEKLGKLGRAEEVRVRMQSDLIKTFLEGDAFCSQLEHDYPELYERFRREIGAQERTLYLDSALRNESPSTNLQSTIHELERHIEETIPGLSSAMAHQLAMSKVADWLMRCPLDFVEESRP